MKTQEQIQKVLDEAFFKVDLTFAAILNVLFVKEVISPEEFEEMKKKLEPMVKEQGDIKKKEMQKLMDKLKTEQEKEFDDLVDLVK